MLEDIEKDFEGIFSLRPVFKSKRVFDLSLCVLNLIFFSSYMKVDKRQISFMEEEVAKAVDH